MTVPLLTPRPIEVPPNNVAEFLLDNAFVREGKDGWMEFRLSVPREARAEAGEAAAWISRLCGLPIDRDPPDDGWPVPPDPDTGWVLMRQHMAALRADGESSDRRTSG